MTSGVELTLGFIGGLYLRQLMCSPAGNTDVLRVARAPHRYKELIWHIIISLSQN